MRAKMLAHRNAETGLALAPEPAMPAPAVAEQMGVVEAALLFTDLRGSSALYRRVGDAAAYRLIRQHFDLLAAVIAEQGGTMVKTIGDAVMAVFPLPHLAVRAALAIQARVGALNQEQPAGQQLAIKLGVHAGPVLAVTLHDRRDYFGEVVNLAAQLRDLSRGGELVVSQSVAEDRLVAPLLAGYASAQERVVLKGSAAVQPLARISRCLRIPIPEGRKQRQW